MTTGAIDISLVQLLFGLVFILAAGITSVWQSLRLERDLLIGTVRTFLQLFMMGYILKVVFNLASGWLVMGVFAFMILFAAWEIRARVRERQVSFFFPLLISMAISYFLVAYLVTAVLVAVKPWWQPQYFIPLGGMIIGNSMNAIAIALERLLGDLRERRSEVEMKLCLGADYKEASQDIVRSAMRSGMIPSINSLMGVGVVFIPGMMTGQILAGADPLVAIRYQIVVMVMLVGATAIGSLIVVLLVRKMCFGAGARLLLTPES
jgi:putative ABC transport system permease protein